MAKQKVFWDVVEQTEAAQLMFARWLDKPMDREKDIFRWVMANKWAAHRQKVPGYLSQKGNPLRPAFLKLVRERLALVGSAKISVAGGATAAPPQPEGTPESGPKILVVEKEMEPDPLHFMRRQPFDVIAMEFLARIVGPLEDIQQRMDRLERRQNGQTTGLTMNAPRPLRVDPAVPDRKFKIGVVGFLPDQFGHIRDKTQAKVDECGAELVWMNKDQSKPVVPGGVRHVIIESSHISHYWSNAVVEMVGSKHTHLVSGITGGTQKVLDILSRQ